MRTERMAEKLAELKARREAREAREASESSKIELVPQLQVQSVKKSKLQIENERLYSELTIELTRLEYFSDMGYEFQFSEGKVQCAWYDSDMPWKNIKSVSLPIIVENLKSIQDPGNTDTEDQKYQDRISKSIEKGLDCELIPKYLWNGR